MAAPPDGEEDALPRGLRADFIRRFLDPDARYVLTRFLLLRLLGLVYFVAFLSAALQIEPLVGPEGLLPARPVVERIAAAAGSRAAAFARIPTIFFFVDPSGAALQAVCWIGAALSLAVLCGATNAIVQLGLWVLYGSLVRVGQLFYGYGWEIQLLETGFLAIFLCPARTVSPFSAAPPPAVVLWLFRWLIVRIMLGAGMIKLRGDPCWRDLTCLVYHYETQPIPSPLSWLLHHAPRPFHQAGVLFNHGVELIAPFFAFGPRRARRAAGILFIIFQITLILSGNLSFLNWLTIVPALACLDDDALARVIPARLRERLLRGAPAEPSRAHRRAAAALGLLVLALSINPVLNLISRGQVMNTSFDPLALVNTYGAFGSVGEERHELILLGTDEEALGERTVWREVELPCKPGDVRRRPCVISPYHYRLDWQIWFAALSRVEEQPWLVHLVHKLLRGDPGVKRLLARDPFPDAPPRWIRIDLYRYEYTPPGDGSGAWWRRTYAGEYLRPVSVEDPDMRRFLEAYGWARE
jgi:hypothetical protein